ncbi:MAG: response regulator [Euryarchaeota archaeon]|nr:response regulator [Euryarchaeota archaeon]|tara:strand:+ start:705 stop:1106 length:402 start_codon:yes stop_codon:yes gene_type:complete
MAVCLRLMDVRALVVEDNQVNVRLLLAMLKGKNITDIEVAEDANQAFEALQTGSFDLIFMDIQLPWTDGLQLTTAIRDHPLVRDSRIIAVTAFSTPEDRRKADAAGCDAFVPKPVRREELYRVIDEQLAARNG